MQLGKNKKRHPFWSAFYASIDNVYLVSEAIIAIHITSRILHITSHLILDSFLGLGSDFTVFFHSKTLSQSMYSIMIVAIIHNTIAQIIVMVSNIYD